MNAHAKLNIPEAETSLSEIENIFFDLSDIESDFFHLKKKDSQLNSHSVIKQFSMPQLNDYLIVSGDADHLNGVPIADRFVLAATRIGSNEALNYCFIHPKDPPVYCFDNHQKCGFYSFNLRTQSKEVYVTIDITSAFVLSQSGLPTVLIPPITNMGTLSNANTVYDLKDTVRRLAEHKLQIFVVCAIDEENDHRRVLSGSNAHILPLAMPITAFDTPSLIKGEIKAQVDISKLKEKAPKTSVIITSFADIEAEKIKWLWHHWLPIGKLTLLAGAGGCGKTTLLLNIISAITVGGLLPDGTKCTDKGSAIIWSSEDDPADTLKPRLMAAGADVSKVHIIQGRINENGDREPFDAATDMSTLKIFAEKIKDLKLFMIDPIVSMVSGDMHRANDVRRSLQVIVDFAAEQRCAVVGITHFAKGTGGGNPAERVIGSQSFSALARMVWTAAQREAERDCILVRAKTNISEVDGGVRYQIEQCNVGDDIETTKATWLGSIEGSARELLNDIESTDNGSSALDMATEFLIELLSSVDRMPTKEIQAQAKDAGLSSASIRRAQEKLNIKPKKPKGETVWFWSLPASFHEVPHVLPSRQQTYNTR